MRCEGLECLFIRPPNYSLVSLAPWHFGRLTFHLHHCIGYNNPLQATVW